MRKPLNRKVLWFWLFISGLVIVLDQLTKFWSTEHLSEIPIRILPGLDLTLRYNTGAAFSFLADASGWQRWFFVGLAFGVTIVIYLWLRRLSRDDRQEGLALSLILGGALGNVIDRLCHGYVIDFILLYYQRWEWPAFNLADSAICLGVILLTPILLKEAKQK